MLIRKFLGLCVLVFVGAETLIDVNPFLLKGIQSEVVSVLEGLVGQEFLSVNASVFSLDDAYQPCAELITEEKLVQLCAKCITDACLKRINQDCADSGQPVSGEVLVEAPPKPSLEAVGGKIIEFVAKTVKKIGSGVKKFFTNILPRIRLPRIRLPRIRLPRIRLPRIRLPRIRLPRIRLPRIRLPRIRLPRIRLPRIRLPRIRLPRIRLPRIRLPRIRLPRIRLPRIRLPRIRLRIFKRKKRQATEPTCEQLLAAPEQNCLYYKSLCPSCSESYVANQTRLINDICGSELVPVYNDLISAQNRLQKLQPLLEIYNPDVFSITGVKYDPVSFNPQAAAYDNVHVYYTVLGTPYTLKSPEPIDPNNPRTASLPLAEHLFESIKNDLL